jgi:hypothetical protein
MRLQKDEILDQLARIGNVAQFASFRPERGQIKPTYNRILGHTPNESFQTAREAVAMLLARSAEGTVNVRSYLPDDPRSREFIYALPSIDEAISVMDRLVAQGLHLIANETIDISDGGVSGVVQEDIIEFAPDDTPRCVEKPGIASFHFNDGLALLTTVYGFEPDLHSLPGQRTEFSIHPRARGWKASHTLLWEHENGVTATASPKLKWPNRFSRLIGDKAFGLLVADQLGQPVPRTLVVGRRVAPFTFGRPTGSAEVWMRTCPAEPEPGLYSTVKGWTDPFALFAREDSAGNNLSSVIRQDAVNAQYSGAALIGLNDRAMIEGRRGEGAGLMLGVDRPEVLPDHVAALVEATLSTLSARLGPARFEWVHDGDILWVVQLHCGSTQTTAETIVPGAALHWHKFQVHLGIELLRNTLKSLPSGVGLMLVGEVGLTSHIADLVRRAGVPTRISSNKTSELAS